MADVAEQPKNPLQNFGVHAHVDDLSIFFLATDVGVPLPSFNLLILFWVLSIVRGDSASALSRGDHR